MFIYFVFYFQTIVWHNFQWKFTNRLCEKDTQFFTFLVLFLIFLVSSIFEISPELCFLMWHLENVVHLENRIAESHLTLEVLTKEISYFLETLCNWSLSPGFPDADFFNNQHFIPAHTIQLLKWSRWELVSTSIVTSHLAQHLVVPLPSSDLTWAYAYCRACSITANIFLRSNCSCLYTDTFQL